jgi:glycosyltransferase involved in cell wall biosynthesis
VLEVAKVPEKNCSPGSRIMKNLVSIIKRAVWGRLSLDKKVKIKRGIQKFFSLKADKATYGLPIQGAAVSWSEVAALEDSDLPVGKYNGQPLANPLVRLIAFYLPQFHPIPENNQWWGEGFTEWSNVRPAKPQFQGHYQPHVPGELGYYDLRDVSVMARQAELAKVYGLGGFCFYFYWFAGRTLLETPVKQYLENADIDFPFCICWANENWSRRWDGLDSQVLIGQQHSDEDDLAFIEYISVYLRDRRYIRVDGKPLLLVYRPSLLPSAKATALRWRNWCLEHGIGEIYLAYTQSFESEDPSVYGFDAAIEFPPNNSSPPSVTKEVDGKEVTFAGQIYDWRIFPERSQKYVQPTYTLFRGVCPSWDNTARRKTKGTIFLGSSPAAYQRWLNNAVVDTASRFAKQNKRLVFVNAWNEWAEGAHLEPDQKYGYAYLQATRDALQQAECVARARSKVIVVSHDAHPHGAQFLALGIVRSLVRELKLTVETVLLGEGRLTSAFQELSVVHQLSKEEAATENGVALATNLAQRGFGLALVNTTVSGVFIESLFRAGIKCITLVHELPGVLRQFDLVPQVRDIAEFSDTIVFPAMEGKKGYEQLCPIAENKVRIRNQGLWRRNLLRFKREYARNVLRNRLGVASTASVILAVGFGDYRKGMDLFVSSCLQVLERRDDAVFVWIGHWDLGMKTEVDGMLQKVGKEKAKAFHFLGYEPNTALYHAGADVYALTSREDPFPNVVMESFDAGVPVVAFRGTGGGADLVSRIGGVVVDMGDVEAFGFALLNLIENPLYAAKLGKEACAYVDCELGFRPYLYDLLSYGGLVIPKISVIVPNYNYAKYIKGRLDTIIKQTLPVYELIILDDASTDDSVEKILEWTDSTRNEVRLVVNEKNSGNVFKQWSKGVAMARGDFVWIAEADDLSASNFLQAVMPAFEDADVVMSYCQSRQIDEAGSELEADYKDYVKDICSERWRSPYIVEGTDEIQCCLAVKNSIPNVSGVIFRREVINSVLKQHLDEIVQYRFAGDWFTYLLVLANGKLSFSINRANLHRRHPSSVVRRGGADELLKEIGSVQKWVSDRYTISPDVARKAKRYYDFIDGYLG